MADAAADLTSRVGGAGNLQSLVGSFADTFFTEAEKLNVLTGNVNGVFESLNLAVPATTEAFKSLVLTQDLMTASGREAYAALLQIAPQFKAIADASSAASDFNFGAFNLSNKQFETETEDRLAQIALARNYSLADAEKLIGAAPGSPAQTSISLLERMAETLDRMEVLGIPGRN